MADEAPASPPGDSPFRGGFRFVDDAEHVTVDVWGSDLTEVLPRAAESLFQAAGKPESFVPAPPFRLEAHGDSAADLVASIATALLSMYRDEGRFTTVAACKSVVSIEEGGTLPAGVACVLVLSGGHVDSEHDPGLRRVALSRSPAGVWEENGILRARFHLHVDGT